eukprot:6197596-Amphidinium_carterae.1
MDEFGDLISYMHKLSPLQKFAAVVAIPPEGRQRQKSYRMLLPKLCFVSGSKVLVHNLLECLVVFPPIQRSQICIEDDVPQMAHSSARSIAGKGSMTSNVH